MNKTLKQEIEEVAAMEHDDPTGLYDNVSVDGAVIAAFKWLSQKRKEHINEYFCQNYKNDKHLLKTCLEILLEEVQISARACGHKRRVTEGYCRDWQPSSSSNHIKEGA